MQKAARDKKALTLGQAALDASIPHHRRTYKGGTLHGDTISFQDAGQRYDVRFAGPIAGPGKAWNLYVLHDMSYEPNTASQSIFSAGTDRLDNLWTKR